MIFDEKVTEYINSAPPEQAEILQKLREIMLSGQGISESIKWSAPTFKRRALLAFLRFHKDHVTLAFFDGTMLSDPKNVLEGGGKQMKHVKVRTLSDIDEAQIKIWLDEIGG